MSDNIGHATIVKWRKNPVLMVREIFDTEPDTWQAKALMAFANQDEPRLRIALQACAGPGKSTVLAWIGWNFLLCYAEVGEHPKGAAISSSRDNLKDNLWSEFSKWQERAPLLMRAFTQTSERIFANDHPKTWFLSARSFSRTANADEQGRTLSGLHGKFVLALIDESGDIPVAVLKTAEQALTKCAFGRIIQSGNPTSHDGMLYAAATRLAHKWLLFSITGDPDDPERSPRIDKDWAQENIDEYGREDPWVMAYILGKFPPSSINTLLGPDEVREAMARSPQEDDYVYSQRRLGIDVARFGDDRNVIFPRQGLVAYKPIVIRQARSHEIAGRIARIKMDWKSEMETVDDTGGYGAGVIDALLQAGQSPIPVNFAGKPNDPRYYNKRSEMWWEMAKWVKRGGALPDEPDLARELTAPTYTMFKGKLRVEEKEKIKARLKFSPDKGDALVLTFAQPDMPAEMDGPVGDLRRRRKHIAESEYDHQRYEG